MFLSFQRGRKEHLETASDGFWPLQKELNASVVFESFEQFLKFRVGDNL